MFDQLHKESEEIGEMKINTSINTTTSSGGESHLLKKICSDCGTNRTPLWRGGPAGPKSLCNACGIRSRKRRWALLGLTNQEVKKTQYNKNNRSKKVMLYSSRDDDASNSNSNSNSNSSSTSDEMSGDEKMWCDVMRMEGLTWHRLTAGKKRRGRLVELGEEEQAAVLLMAMAYSSVLV